MTKSLCQEQTFSTGAKIIKKYHLNYKDFPKALMMARQRQIRWEIKNKPWYVLEEKFLGNYEMLGHLALICFQCKDIKNKKLLENAAFSLIQGHNLLNKNITVRDQLKYSFNHSAKNLQYISNPIFEKDSFRPLEENLQISPQGTFINLKDLGILEKDLHFIDNLEQRDFIFAKKTLENSEIVRFF